MWYSRDLLKWPPMSHFLLGNFCGTPVNLVWKNNRLSKPTFTDIHEEFYFALLCFIIKQFLSTHIILPFIRDKNKHVD